MRAFNDAGLSISINLELAGVEGVKQAVRAGLGGGFISIMSMRHEGGSLVVLPVEPLRLQRQLSILVPHAQAQDRATTRFLESCLAGWLDIAG